LTDDYVGRNNKMGQKKAVPLREVGPRMELWLINILEGAPGKEGAVLYHEFGALQINHIIMQG
jgi:ribosome biogenesis protein SSF1/2